MAYLPYILPWVMLLLAAGAAVATKFLELKSIVGIATLSTSGIVFIVCGVMISINASHLSHEAKEAHHKLEEMEEWKYRHLDEITLALAQIRPLSESGNMMLSKLKDYGWIPQQPATRRLERANEVREGILASYYPRGQNLFKGLPKLVDQTLLDLSLRQVSFTNIPYRKDEEIPDEVNVIYYGKSLDIRDVKLAALTLMRAGVELRAIKPFPKDTQGNLQAIKAEFNKTLDVRRALTAEEIEKATIFK